MEPQYSFRAQKVSGLVDSPSWDVSSAIPSDLGENRCFAYSANGEWYAYATPSGVHLLPLTGSSSTSSKTLPATGVFALSFSPLSKTLFTFERPQKLEGNEVHKNVRAWDLTSGEEIAGWNQKSQDNWEPLITPDETHRFLPTGSDILIFSPPLAARPYLRLKGDGSPIRGIFISHPRTLPDGTTNAKPLRPADECAVAIWLGEKSGQPGGVRLYPLSQLVGGTEAKDDAQVINKDLPIALSRKAFYKADKLNVKWNNAGNMALFLTQNDVDSTGRSYYGETNLYLVSLDGSFDGMVDLDKEGPIFDFNWSPTSREFAVCYGYMPSRTQLFDLKTKPIHSFGSQHRNLLIYQPQGKLLLSAGFGNLAGGVDIWDISTRNKVAEFKAPNSSHCEWSPCGRYILTATLSPRLRVDNSVKIWWCGGQLLHIHPIESLYQAAFKPSTIDKTPSFPAVLPGAPEANPSVALYRPKGEETNGASSKPAGAYRPPGARGTLASDAYKRDENDHSAPGSGATTPTPMFKGGKPGGRYVPGTVPGAPVPGQNGPAKGGEQKKRVRSKRPMKEKGDEGAEANGNGSLTPADAEVEKVEEGVKDMQVSQDQGGAEEVIQKKIRGLNKKLKAIEDLKDRQKKGETLEKTQLMKIETESQIRSEIASLSG